MLIGSGEVFRHGNLSFFHTLLYRQQAHEEMGERKCGKHTQSDMSYG